MSEAREKAFTEAIHRSKSLYDEIAASHPSLLRGRVWCVRCGKFREVNAADALRRGWPQCHGETMTIESPEERAKDKCAP